MTSSDRIATAFLALVSVLTSAWGFHLATDAPDTSHPVRWSPEVAIVLDSDSYQADAARKALAAWAPALPTASSISPQGNIQVLVLDPKNPRAGGEAKKKIEDRWIIGCTIILRADLLPELVLPALTHEMGHCLGLQHDLSKGPSIMYYDMGGWEQNLFSFDMTDHDLANMQRLYAL